MEQYISITRREFQLSNAGVSGMYCSILITISQEENSIRMEQYIPDTPAYVSWNPLLVIL
jgi:hypothetical protein